MQVIATAGHVDHGKSTLVRALTGMEPDRWEQERQRGMTIDLGFAWTVLPSGATVAFVDVPGHERFVGNMLAGVGPAPAALVVVAADEGWMPQSAEHLDALEAFGVRDGLLVVSRSDLMEPELARDEALAHLAGSALGRLPAVCVSAVTGAGVDELRGALDELVARLPTADPDADVRFWVDRAFTIRGAGTVITGTLTTGRIRVGDELELAGRRVTVRGLQSLGEPVEEAVGVARVALNLRGLPRERITRGDVLLTPGAWLVSGLIDVRLHGLRGRPPDAAALPAELMLHIGSAAVPVRVRPLGHDFARLRLAGGRPAHIGGLPLRIGDRAVLRDPGRRRVAAGVTVLDVHPPALRRRGDAAHRAAELAGLSGVPDAFAELARRGVVRAAELTAMGVDVRPLRAAGVPAAGGWLLDPGSTSQLAERLAGAVTEHDAADPLDPGLPLDAARRVLGLPDAGLIELILQCGSDTSPPARSGTGGPPVSGMGAQPVATATDAAALTATGVALELRNGRVMRSTATALPAAVRSAMENLRADLERDPFAAPTAERLDELGLGTRQLASLVRTGELMRIADGIYLLPGTDERALRILAGLGEEFTLSTARQALGTTRRVAVPLLEFLARSGRTRRTPDGGHRLLDRPGPCEPGPL
jgi:selenocysteine-specific elongation factor